MIISETTEGRRNKEATRDDKECIGEQISHEEEVANRKFQLEIKRQNKKFREEHPDYYIKSKE